MFNFQFYYLNKQKNLHYFLKISKNLSYNLEIETLFSCHQILNFIQLKYIPANKTSQLIMKKLVSFHSE